MCSLNNAINLYREEAEKEDKKCFMIVMIIGTTQIPIHNREDEIDFYNDLETAEIDRMYYQSDIAETLKVIKL